jgi:hypothetical protein
MSVTTADFLLGLFLGILAGMAIAVTRRAFRDLRDAKAFVKARQRLAWGSVPNLTLWAVVAVCAAVAAIRLFMGSGG